LNADLCGIIKKILVMSVWVLFILS